MILAIDPGVSGALVLLEDGQIADAMMMPVSMDGKKKVVNPGYISDWIMGRRIDHAFLEKVSAMPGQGVTSMFGFGRSYGVIQGVLAAYEISYALVTPQAWKKHHGLIGQDKDAARLLAKELFPESELFDKKLKGQAFADATLIGLYGSSLSVDHKAAC